MILCNTVAHVIQMIPQEWVLLGLLKARGASSALERLPKARLTGAEMQAMCLSAVFLLVYFWDASHVYPHACCSVMSRIISLMIGRGRPVDTPAMFGELWIEQSFLEHSEPGMRNCLQDLEHGCDVRYLNLSWAQTWGLRRLLTFVDEKRWVPRTAAPLAPVDLHYICQDSPAKACSAGVWSSTVDNSTPVQGGVLATGPKQKLGSYLDSGCFAEPCQHQTARPVAYKEVLPRLGGNITWAAVAQTGENSQRGVSVFHRGGMRSLIGNHAVLLGSTRGRRGSHWACRGHRFQNALRLKKRKRQPMVRKAHMHSVTVSDNLAFDKFMARQKTSNKMYFVPAMYHVL